jgi:Fe-S-cluster containining protein
LAKWSEEELNNLIEKVDKNWNILVEGHPEVRNFLLKTNNRDIDEINSLVDKTSFPCIFLDDNTNLCKIYDVRPFKCRIFGNTYYYPQDEGGVAIVCHRYGRVINEDNFDLILYDVTELLDKNTDLSIIHDKSGNMPFLSPEYPLIYYLYQHFIVS